ncbi:hypothetical protein J6590_069993 [Homalodisca vitripennis]|nr:hypothetical protein J6590_069993 [Homalodisca vitripennis]
MEQGFHSDQSSSVTSHSPSCSPQTVSINDLLELWMEQRFHSDQVRHRESSSVTSHSPSCSPQTVSINDLLELWMEQRFHSD